MLSFVARSCEIIDPSLNLVDRSCWIRDPSLGSMPTSACLACKSRGEEVTYIGQSRRPIRARFNEHLGNACLRSPHTGLGDHTLLEHANMDTTQINSNFHIEILTTKEHEADPRICESVYIRENGPTMNTKSRSRPLTKHVI